MLYRRRRLLLLAQAAQTPSDPNLQSLLEALYGNGEQGVFYVPKPQVLGQQVLFQDAAGTTPVTAPGDPVGVMLDLSGNDNHATQEVSGSRPVYRTNGTRHWLEGDGVDDTLPVPLPTLSNNATLFYVSSVGVNIQPNLPAGVSLDFLSGAENYYYGVVDRPITENEKQLIKNLAPVDKRDTAQAMWLDGSQGTYALTPHSDAQDITGDITLVAKVVVERWAAGRSQDVIVKWVGNLQFLFRIAADGGLFFARDSAAGRNQGRVAFPNAPVGRPVWIAAAIGYVNEGCEARFFTSDDGVVWSHLGTLLRSHPGPALSSNGAIGVGASSIGGNPVAGKIYRAQIYDGAGFTSDGPQGTLVADFNAEDATLGSGGGDTFVSSSTGETWTLHGNAAIGEYPA